MFETLNCLESGKTNKCHRRILQTLKYFPFFSLVLDIYVANRDRSSIFKNKKVIAKILFPSIDFLKLSLQIIFSLNFLIPVGHWEIYQTNWQFTWRNRNLHPSSLNMTQSVRGRDEQEYLHFLFTWGNIDPNLTSQTIYNNKTKGAIH